MGPLLQDLERVFPELAPITAEYLNSVGGHVENPSKKRQVYLKEKFNEFGTRIAVIAYMAVRDDFEVPAWIQGTELSPLDPVDVVDHYFMGHEIPVPDDPNEAPEEPIL